MMKKTTVETTTKTMKKKEQKSFAKKMAAILACAMTTVCLTACGGQDGANGTGGTSSEDLASNAQPAQTSESAAETAEETAAEDGQNTLAESEEAADGAVSGETGHSEAGNDEAENGGTEVDGAGKTLVVYFSATGNTESVAGYIAEAAGADLLELEAAKPYTSDDLNWRDENSRVVYEHDNPNDRQAELVTTAVEGWESYDTVYIGYPIWWGVAAWPVDSFVTVNDFTGKTVIPFCTSSSSGLGESGDLLAEEAGTGEWLEGKRFPSNASAEDVQAWVETVKN